MAGKPPELKVFLTRWLIIAILMIMAPTPFSQAAENGMGVYPLGYNSSMAGFMPPPGLYLRNDVYVYQGTANKIPLSGRIEASLAATSWTWLTPPM